MPLDPLIPPLAQQDVIRVCWAVEIGTAAPRRYTNFPGGVVVDGDAYTYMAGLQVSSLSIGGGGGAPRACEIAMADINNENRDLVLDAANLKCSVVIRRNWFDPDWVAAAWQTWFTGFGAAPYFDSALVRLACTAYLGRRGSSPRTSSKDIMVNHAPPDKSTHTPWFGAGR